MQWTSGGRLDLVRIGEACRKLGAALVLDLTQSLGALPFSVGGLKNNLQNGVQPDFAVAASYKWLLGPYSVGLLYVAPKWQSGMPLEENWIQRANARDFSSLILYTEDYDAGARRFDMGERANFALAARRRARHEAVAGVESRADLRNGRGAQSSPGRSRGGPRIFRATRTIARASLSVAAEESGDSEGTSRNAGARESIRQRPRKFDSSDAQRLQHGRGRRAADRVPTSNRDLKL